MTFINEVQLKPMYPRSLVDRYLVGRVIGEGASAVVRVLIKRKTCNIKICQE